MVTDPVPRAASKRQQHEASDALRTIALPSGPPLQSASQKLAAALVGAVASAVKRAGDELLAQLSAFFGVSVPRLSVLGVRPHRVVEGHLSYELFGDYTFDTETIRVWMRTAIRGKVTSHRGLLNTLLHEFCHHLDLHALGFTDTPHTRGFFSRVDLLYHLALDTPAERRKPLVWIKRRGVWHIDWAKLR